MKGWIVLVAVVLAGSVLAADLCSDTDSGGEHRSDAALKTKGEVKYGITTMVDTCLTSKEGVSTNASKWLKEYYCRQDKRESEVYDCFSLGFEGCVDGECKGTTSGTTTTTNTTNATTQTTAADCGDKIVEKSKGEECDPPNSICFGRSVAEYGTCQSDCKCKVAEAALKERKVVCGDNYTDAGEECEADADCQSGFVCSSCKCVKILTQAEIDAMKKTSGGEVKDNISKEIEEKYKAPELPDVNLSATNFSEEPAIKATSSITNFFKKIFGWIAAIFS